MSKQPLNLGKLKTPILTARQLENLFANFAKAFPKFDVWKAQIVQTAKPKASVERTSSKQKRAGSRRTKKLARQR